MRIWEALASQTAHVSKPPGGAWRLASMSESQLFGVW